MKNVRRVKRECVVVVIVIVVVCCVAWEGGMGSCGEVAGSRLEKTRFG